MSDQRVTMASSTETLMVEPEVVRQVRVLRARGWGVKRIARELKLARNTVRRYVVGGAAAERQVRPAARALSDEQRAEAVRLFEGEAEGNAVVVSQLLRERGIEAGVRTVQRAVADRRRERRVAELATVRYETGPGQQAQVDFGQKLVEIAGRRVKVFLLVVVLSYSRRIFAKAFLSERGDDWREGIAEAFQHFGGVPQTLLGDNASALVTSHDRRTNVVTFHPAYLAFCREWDVQPRACAPYRARTKGKVEKAVGYLKHNALAGRRFDTFAELEGHLAAWLRAADERVHGTTHEIPLVRFEREERTALRPLPAVPPASRVQLLTRTVAKDCLVDLDTIRYSVPSRFIEQEVAVDVGEDLVRIFSGSKLVATHPRSRQPYDVVRDEAHYADLRRPQSVTPHPDPSAPAQGHLEALGSSLAAYAAVVEQEAA